MYTQCPECGVAFRVTAEVLKQAAGKVRCGGCGVAFNALNHLSEQKPAAPVQSEPPPDPHVPELKPEEPGELEADTPPQSISAEQSAALLKTLDQLAGSDIRIEDTGVEWRVLDDDEVETSDDVGTSDDTPDQQDLIADTGSLRFVVEGEEDISADEPSEVVAEMRFDDNTPLPDDFDFAGEPATRPEPRIEAPAPDPEPEPEDAQADLALGDPEEWEDLLGDLDEPAVAEVEEEPEPEPDEEPDEAREDLVMLADTQAEDSADQPLDMDTQFAIQAEAMGIDLSGIHETVQHEAELETGEEPEIDDELETSIEEDLIAAAFEAEAAAIAQEAETSVAGPLDKEDEEEEDELEEETEIEEEEEEEIELELGVDLETEGEFETEDDVEDIALVFDDKVEEVIETIAASLDDDDEPEAMDKVADDSGDEQLIAEMSEEEKTINMMIDQELFNVAVEDEDGFASTIVQIQPDKKVEGELDDNKKEEKEDRPPLVETIIMEGEFIRGDLDKERLAADKSVETRNLDDPGVSIPLKKTMYGAIRHTTPPGAAMIGAAVALVLLLILQAMHQSREALATVPAFNSAVGPIYRMLGQPLTPTWDVSGWRIEATKGSTEIVGLSDDAADSEAPVQTDEILTIYSRIGNRSEKALPYPLVHVSLTDRFEEIIGSRVLEPAEYLAENADPRKPVAPGNTFNAVISIESAADVATGFRLDVCYRLANGQLRCAIEDFK